MAKIKHLIKLWITQENKTPIKQANTGWIKTWWKIKNTAIQIDTMINFYARVNG
nr:hypothetical protein [Mycoplasmopsis bovis]